MKKLSIFMLSMIALLCLLPFIGGCQEFDSDSWHSYVEFQENFGGHYFVELSDGTKMAIVFVPKSAIELRYGVLLIPTSEIRNSTEDINTEYFMCAIKMKSTDYEIAMMACIINNDEYPIDESYKYLEPDEFPTRYMWGLLEKKDGIFAWSSRM